MQQRFTGKVALITGAATGMGRAHANRLHAEGATVYMADIDRAAAARAALSLGTRSHPIVLDVISEHHWEQAAETLRDRHGRLDVLINNAGVLHTSPLEETTLADWDRIIRVNLTGPFLALKALAPLLRASSAGAVVNVSSPAGLQGRSGMTAYSASKFGLRGLTQSAALELADAGVRVNSIHPGTVRTAMLDGHDEEALAARIPLQRIGEPGDIAALVAFLCSEEAGYITGAEFVADGGRHAGPTR